MAVKSNKYRMKQAADRAKAKVGKANKYRYCLQECVNGSGTPYAIPGPWGWGGNGNDTAINFWLNAVAKGKVVKTSDPGKIPAGALVFMVNNADKGKAKPAGAGHVFIGAGGGYAYSTDRPSNGHWGRVTIKSIEQAWGKTLVGYVLITGDGYDLQDKLVVTEKDNRWETTASLLNLRAAPVDGKVLAQVKRGTIIDTVGYAPVQGSVWQVDASSDGCPRSTSRRSSCRPSCRRRRAHSSPRSRTSKAGMTTRTKTGANASRRSQTSCQLSASRSVV